MAESASGRFRAALEALAEYLPLIVIELRVWRGANEAVVVPETAIVNESLDIAGTAGPVGGQARTEADWREQCTEEAWAFKEAFVDWTTANLGEVRVDYSPKSYIGVRRGRRVWAPLWPRSDGAFVYLPDPDGSREEEPSVAFEHLGDDLITDGLTPAWQRNYNAGANPIAVRLKRGDLEKNSVQNLLRASWAILDPDATPWSERNPVRAVGPRVTGEGWSPEQGDALPPRDDTGS